MTSKPAKIPPRPADVTYRSFMARLPQIDRENPPLEPINPAQRVTHEAIGTLAHVMDAIIRTEVAVLGHFPEALRLKVSRLLRATAERAEAANAALVCYKDHGTLTPRGARPRTKRRLKP